MHAPPLSSSSLGQYNSSWCGIQTIKLLTLQLSLASCHSLPSYFHVSTYEYNLGTCQIVSNSKIKTFFNFICVWRLLHWRPFSRNANTSHGFADFELIFTAQRNALRTCLENLQVSRCFVIALLNLRKQKSCYSTRNKDMDTIEDMRTQTYRLYGDFRPSAYGATQNKLIGHSNYQPVTSELLPL